MAMGAVRNIIGTGVSANLQTPLSSESVAPVEDLTLHVKNASGSSINVTVVDAGFTPAGGTGTIAPVAVPATTGDMYIAIPYAAFNPATGLITVNFSATTSVTAEWLVR